MSGRRRTVLAAGAMAGGVAVVGALAAARPALDVLMGRVEAGMNRVGPAPGTPVSERARELHATLRVADLHADSLLWGGTCSCAGIAGTWTCRA